MSIVFISQSRKKQVCLANNKSDSQPNGCFELRLRHKYKCISAAKAGRHDQRPSGTEEGFIGRQGLQGLALEEEGGVEVEEEEEKKKKNA
jgi:hypothetical protein